MIQKKICLLGASAVGKTSLIKQYIEGVFSDKYLTTLGVKVDKKQVQLGPREIQLMVWDIEGIDRYCGFQPKYLRGASAFIIVVDHTRSQSLQEGMEIFQLAQETTNIPAVLVINKTDLPEQWHWTEHEVETRSHMFADCFRTSAKTGEQVDAMFQAVARLCMAD
ncbi:Rab family GTPase [Alteromonas halophila]|uniref:GTP-binding protein n=1 Tax=Alteromonas halophila TaxID=516698 RepID=A0A918JHE4_9ALTE|nr:Rab family GTPase [Alteromonas halophila]GGW81593.1 GTP-binding protein [Alteromonas halophila]